MQIFNESILSVRQKVLVKFGADWCGPCKAVEPILEKMSSEGFPVYKVDSDSDQDLVIKYNVRSIPTFILFKNSKEVSRIYGTQTEADLLNFFAQE